MLQNNIHRQCAPKDLVRRVQSGTSLNVWGNPLWEETNYVKNI